MKARSKRPWRMLLALCMVLSLVPVTAFAADPTVIDRVDFTFADLSYQAGETPKKMASVTGSNAHYTIYDEYIEEVKDKPGETNVVVPTGYYWHSNPLEMARIDSDKQITKLEVGKKYAYCIVFQPESSKYKFDENTTEVYRDGFNLGNPTYGNLKMVDSGFRIAYHHYMYISVSGDSEDKVITSAAVENVKLDYKDGEAPQASARRAGVNMDKYDILYESWGKRENTDEFTTKTVAYWYSDDGWYNEGDERLTAFDKDGQYQYQVRLKAKDGYTFNGISADDITLNGKSLPEDSYVTVLDESKSCIVIYGMTLRTVRPLESVTLNGVSTEFYVDGDKPRFNGYSGSAFSDVAYEMWEDKDDRTIGINSDENLNGGYSQLITSFKYGKTYTYGVAFNIADLGLEQGYRFDENTKLYIHDKEVTLNPEQVQVIDGGMTIQFADVFSMTPEGGSVPHSHNYGEAWKYDETNHWHECACGDKADITAHVFKWIVDKEATATEKGSGHTECIVCGYKNSAVDIPATGSETKPTGKSDQIGKSGSATSPKTGDTSNPALWIALLLASGGTAVGATVAGRKKSARRS